MAQPRRPKLVDGEEQRHGAGRDGEPDGEARARRPHGTRVARREPGRDDRGGVAEDVRATSSQLAYDQFEPVVPERAAGDVQARLEQRALELWQSLDLLEILLARPVDPVSATRAPLRMSRTAAPSTQSTTPFASAATLPPMKHLEYRHRFL